MRTERQACRKWCRRGSGEPAEEPGRTATGNGCAEGSARIILPRAGRDSATLLTAKDAGRLRLRREGSGFASWPPGRRAAGGGDAIGPASAVDVAGHGCRGSSPTGGLTRTARPMPARRIGDRREEPPRCGVASAVEPGRPAAPFRLGGPFSPRPTGERATRRRGASPDLFPQLAARVRSGISPSPQDLAWRRIWLGAGSGLAQDLAWRCRHAGGEGRPLTTSAHRPGDPQASARFDPAAHKNEVTM
jgi:hypothetical protein